jgi:hypothetical protein
MIRRISIALFAVAATSLATGTQVFAQTQVVVINVDEFGNSSFTSTVSGTGSLISSMRADPGPGVWLRP